MSRGTAQMRFGAGERLAALRLIRSRRVGPAGWHRMVGENGVSMIQWRNLNIDPEWYFDLMKKDMEDGGKLELSPSMGLTQFMKRLKKLCPWLRHGYFNPYVGEKAELTAPMPGAWSLPEPRAKEGALAPGESAETALE